MASAGYGLFGAGCAGTRPVTNLVANGLPELGGTLTVALNNLPISAAFLVTGLSRTTASFGALPFDLTSLGAPGCLARVSDDARVLLVGTANAAVWNLGIPNAPGLVGLQAYNQAVVFDPGFNGIGAVVSDAAGLMIGN